MNSDEAKEWKISQINPCTIYGVYIEIRLKMQLGGALGLIKLGHFFPQVLALRFLITKMGLFSHLNFNFFG